jgi:hypothetical protein
MRSRWRGPSDTQTGLDHASHACRAFLPAPERDTGCSHPSLIVDLDTAIQAAVEHWVRVPKMAKLTRIYRNLIRYWIEV